MSSIEIETREAVRTLTLRNDGKLNAFDAPMLDALVTAVAEANEDNGIRVIVLTGAGRAFCAGGDTSTMGTQPDAGENLAFLTGHVHAAQLALWHSAKPVIAAMNGAAVGAGLDIALACDFRIAAQSAVLSEGYIRAGLVAGDGGAWLLPRLVGAARAAELLLTGRRITPEEAERIGMVTRVVSTDELAGAVHDLATELAALPPTALAGMKKLIHQSLDVAFETGLQLGADRVSILQVGQEHKDAVAALRTEKK